MNTMKPVPDTKLKTTAGESSSATHSDDDLPLVDATKKGTSRPLSNWSRDTTVAFSASPKMLRTILAMHRMLFRIFLKAYQKLDQFRATARFSTWLIRITLNEALMKVRKLRNQAEVSAEEVQDEREAAPSRLSYWARNPEQLYSASELREILRKSLETMLPGLKIVFVLRDIEELSIAETAEALGLTVVAVKARLFRARLQLRAKLSKHFATREQRSELSSRRSSAAASTEFDNLMTSSLQSTIP